MYIIAGCNGAGKTTASLSLLPDVLKCKEFVNADYIAAGLSPLNPERYSFEAGRIMIRRMDELIDLAEDFAIETTLPDSIKLEFNRLTKKDFRLCLSFFGCRLFNWPKSGLGSESGWEGTPFHPM
jgi:predicted ABC-type ATPase